MEGIIWRPGIGDPTIIGWITTVGYAISAFLCARKARVLKTDILTADTQKSEMLNTQALNDERLVWSGLATVLFCLGLNKQLDLQTLMIECGRNFAVSEGWFSERRKIQAVFVIFAISLGVLILIIGVWKQRRFFRKHPPTLIGVSLLVLYISLRLTAIDHVGQASGVAIPDEAWWLTGIEWGGIACTGMTAERRVNRK